ncbi:hypothetical protein POM88_052242 [Heracleum sosnowskyi]|uniref:NuBaID C-terminal domain-containing protein n=1 Tax=Heracleum sosnowskyi TaxID=360622 RepID=A0AAD8GT50_9APIA|nr:hypothetical protein POM88_052242 [Heracleum sosnowskyi]
MIYGQNKDITNQDKHNLAVKNSNVGEAGEVLKESENSGLQIIDPKRRRLEEPSTHGPSDYQNETDTEMIETQNNAGVESKNLSMAASKDEVTQAGKASPTDDSGYPGAGDMVANGKGPPNGENNYEEAVEFDPIKNHNYFCPWVNGNVAAAGSSSNSGSGSGASAIALCGWQLTLDALDSFQSLGQAPVQTVESESAASLCKTEDTSITTTTFTTGQRDISIYTTDFREV